MKAEESVVLGLAFRVFNEAKPSAQSSYALLLEGDFCPVRAIVETAHPGSWS